MTTNKQFIENLKKLNTDRLIRLFQHTTVTLPEHMYLRDMIKGIDKKTVTELVFIVHYCGRPDPTLRYQENTDILQVSIKPSMMNDFPTVRLKVTSDDYYYSNSCHSIHTWFMTMANLSTSERQSDRMILETLVTFVAELVDILDGKPAEQLVDTDQDKVFNQLCAIFNVTKPSDCVKFDGYLTKNFGKNWSQVLDCVKDGGDESIQKQILIQGFYDHINTYHQSQEER